MKARQIDRRLLLGAAGVAAATALLPGQARAQGNYSFAQGDFQITVFSDGFVSIPEEIMAPDVPEEARRQLLTRLDADAGIVRAKANIPLIRAAKDLILVDIGSGSKYQPSDGRLAAQLAAAGIDPAAVTKIVFTHAHPDHIWATLAENGGLRFPNATYFVGATEWDFWMDPNYLTSMPDAVHEYARGAQRDLHAIKERAVMLKPGDDVITGITAIDTAGHTPGHLSFALAGREGLIITADVANNEIVSFEHPEWKFGYDLLSEIAIRNRKRLLDQAATDRTRLLGYHWAYPGVGYAERSGAAFRFARAS